MHGLKNSLKKILSPSARKWLRRQYNPVSSYFFSSSTKPLSEWHGFDRGTPLDRFYIEGFLEKNKHLIHGTCLEIFDDTYTKRFGETRVAKADILDIESSNTNATIIADLRNMPQIADNSYDTIILTQVFQFIDAPEAALRECYRILKPGGHILATLPCLSRMDRISGIDADYWRFTKAGTKVLFEKAFEPSKLRIESCGNVRSGILSWIGASVEDASRHILEKNDAQFPLLINVVAEK